MNSSFRIIIAAALISIFAAGARVTAQQILFDFDNAPLYTSFPIAQSAGGITAYFTATGQGYSIQNANVIGFTPPGFSGRIIYPSSIYLSDIRIKYDHALTEFSIMYACQELGCDDAARMRVTAYRNGAYVGTSTRTATFPGTWPVDTLRCSFAAGFDSVIVHYDAPPPTCQDYGVIYMADNMKVTPMNVNGINPESGTPAVFSLSQNYPNPFNPSTEIYFTIPQTAFVTLKVYDISGREISTLTESLMQAGTHSISFNGKELSSGIYFYRLETSGYSDVKKMILLK